MISDGPTCTVLGLLIIKSGRKMRSLKSTSMALPMKIHRTLCIIYYLRQPSIQILIRPTKNQFQRRQHRTLLLPLPVAVVLVEAVVVQEPLKQYYLYHLYSSRFFSSLQVLFLCLYNMQSIRKISYPQIIIRKFPFEKKFLFDIIALELIKFLAYVKGVKHIDVPSGL